jgi:hypothetical protein
MTTWIMVSYFLLAASTLWFFAMKESSVIFVARSRNQLAFYQ